MFLRDNANKKNFEGNIGEMIVSKKLNLARDEAHAAAKKSFEIENIKKQSDTVQRSAQVDAPGCVNAAGKPGQSESYSSNKIHQTWCTDFSQSL